MLRSIAIAFSTAVGLYVFTSLAEVPFGPSGRAALALVVGIAISALAFGDVGYLAVAAGALSPLPFAWLEQRALAWAIAMLCFAWLLPRAVLARTGRAAASVVAVTLAAAGVAGFVTAAFVESGTSERIASCLFAGSCLSLVSAFLPVDTPDGWALRNAARVISPPLGERLDQVARIGSSLPPAKRAQLRKLVRLADRRAALAKLEGEAAETTRRDLDERIATELAALLAHDDGHEASAADFPPNEEPGVEPPTRGPLPM